MIKHNEQSPQLDLRFGFGREILSLFFLTMIYRYLFCLLQIPFCNNELECTFKKSVTKKSSIQNLF